jgi:hypothetical protein
MTGPDPSDPPEKILHYVAVWDEPFVTAGDIEPKLTVGQKQTFNRLNALVDDGLLDSRTVGPNATLFWITDEGRELLADAEFQRDSSGR